MKRVLLVLAIAACSKTSDSSKAPVAPSPATAPTAPAAATAQASPASATEPATGPARAPVTGDLAWHDVDAKRPLADSLAAFTRDAKAAGLKPFAYLHASWCGPCKAIEKTHAADAQMTDAFKGTAIALIDIDAADPKALSAQGLDTQTIPVFFRLDASGKPTGDKIDGGAWGDNVPDNMAPPLKAFFAK